MDIGIYIVSQPYACDICEQLSGNLKEYNGHRNIHEVSQPYACDICENKFENKNE